VMAAVVPPGWHRIFVYGTLKRGYTNHSRYLSVAEAHGGARLLHSGATGCSTVSRYALVVRPEHMPPATCGPVMMELEDDRIGWPVSGEVWKVSAATLEALDILEGVRAGHYYKKSISVCTSEDEDAFSCTAYFYPASPELLALPLLSSYGDAEHAQYKPTASLNPQIIELCRRGHVLATQGSCAMRVHCLRLLPNDDVLAALKRFVSERSMGAVAVLSAVGSTGTTALRPAGLPRARVFEGKFEVVSLSGTISASGGHHLHMSISDAECHVYGGHVMPGCLVRTTLEVVLGEIEGVEFARPMDLRTGYDELSIVPSIGLKRGRDESE